MPVNYGFGVNGEFRIEGYDRAKTFASFLPGVAGMDGIPMWSFYVNRGQAMGSFGVRDKDGAIMEFFPANLLYRNIDRQGFRTFVRHKGRIHEPFSSISTDDCTRTMFIGMNSLRIAEENRALVMRIAVTYFTMPGEDFAAIVRKVEFENLGMEDCDVEILDGLPQILPHGVTNAGYQATANLLRAWFSVTNAENGIAYYKVRASTQDTAEVREMEEGDFFLSFSSESKGLIPPVFDMDVIFGTNTALSRPDGWDCPLEELYKRKQVPENKVSGGFAGAKAALKNKLALYTVIGHAASPASINARKRDFTPEYIERKRREAEALAEALVENTCTKTAFPLFDRYISQCNLDNLLRGGYPLVFGAGGRNIVYHVYSRKHGDTEREYNFFSLEPGFYSQGNGNYRDVCQNRRSDVLLNPLVGDFNVKQFASLIQADGYNPLLVKGSSFTLDTRALPGLLARAGGCRGALEELLKSKFTPGRLAAFAREHREELGPYAEVFLEDVLANSRQEFEAEFGEGYWIDHWTYVLDLVESYLAVYPDRKEEFLFGDRSYRFFHSPVRVLPRADKYVEAGGKARRFGAIRMEGNAKGTRWLRTKNGRGEIYETNLFAKLATLALVKFTSLDPFGMGVEMEADRPGWNDAMNGLPGLFGSGLGEASELKRLVSFLIEACSGYDREVRLFSEAAALLDGIEKPLRRNLSCELGDFEYWDRVSGLKEKYREKIGQGIDGREKRVSTKALLQVYRKIAEKLRIGLDKALAMGNGIHPTYFTYQAAEYKTMGDRKNPVNGYPCVRITGFECRPLPLFLEGPARVLKTAQDADEAARLYEAVRESGIYDRKLGMYKTSEPLGKTSVEVGRIMAFTPGWLEREAVFVHMEYKYLYAVLKAGLYEQFFRDMRSALIPFLKPEVYGRSTLENSTFIASSVNPDETMHGRGFVARMSGSTAEMLSIWFAMMTGGTPFHMENGSLALRLCPILPGWLFDGDGKLSFKFLGKTTVTYVNPDKRDTYGENSSRPQKCVLHTSAGDTVEFAGPAIPAPYAEAVRNGEISGIEIFFS